MKQFYYLSLNWYNSLIIIIGFVFISLSIYKASHTAFTHDESFTYLSYVKKSVFGIITMEEPISANNHILNSLSMKVIDKLLAPTPFNLRLPNIFGHLLFIIFSALFISTYKNVYFKVISFVILNSNIYLIDLFSLARGYGLSLGFLMVHWYFLKNTMGHLSQKTNFRLMLIALLLAMLSSFSVIYYTISLAIIYLVNEISNVRNKAQFLVSNIKFILLFLLLTIALLLAPMLKLVQHHQLYFGGTNNFFDDTIYSLIYYSVIAAGMTDSQINTIYIFVLILILVALIFQLIRLFRNKISIESNFFLASFLLIMIIQIAFFYLFNTKYLIQRTALFLIPVFVFMVLGIVNELGNNMIYFLAAFTALFMFYITIRFTPLDKSLNWGYDADNEKLISELNSMNKHSNAQNKLSLGVDWIFQPSLNYYRATTDAGVWLDTITKEGYDLKKFQYYFVESISLNKFVDTSQFKVLKTFQKSNNILIKNLKFE